MPENAASNIIRLETGAVHTAWYARIQRMSFGALASGAVVGLPPPAHCWQDDCSSQNAASLLRRVICHVVRSDELFHQRSASDCLPRSGTYVQALGSPAFLLKYVLEIVT